MTAKEICRDYLLAANPRAQIGILADLNLVSKAEIVEILKSRGVSFKSARKKCRSILWTDAKLNQLEMLVDHGLTVREMAPLLEIKDVTIFRKIHELGLNKRKLRSG